MTGSWLPLIIGITTLGGVLWYANKLTLAEIAGMAEMDEEELEAVGLPNLAGVPLALPSVTDASTPDNEVEAG